MQKEKINKIYLSKTIWGEVSHLCSQLAKKPETLSQKRIVICEESFTLSLEKMLAKSLGGIMTTRVMSFGKICDTIKSQEKYLSKTSEIMLLSKLISEMDGELELFSGASNRPTFANSIYDILSLLSSSHVDFEKLEKQNLPPSLEKKIADICKINRKYQSAKAGLFLDATDKMQALYQSFDSVEILKNAEIHIVGHTAFTNQMLAVISKMLSQGNVTIYLLSSMQSVENSISAIAQNCEISLEKETIASELPPISNWVSSCLQENETQTEKCDNLSLLQFSCTQYERENIALKIKEMLQNGVMPEDISLVLGNFTGDIDNYSQLFEKYGVPYFANVTKTLEKFPFPQHILALADLKTSNYSLDSVRKMLKSPFSPLSKEDSFNFENFLISRNVDRGRFFRDDIFAKAGLLDTRDKFIRETDIFTKTALTAEEFAEICENLALSKVDTLASMQYGIASYGMIDHADFLALSIKKTLEVLSEMKTVLLSEVFTLEKMATIFEGGICGKEIATIPPQIHAVEIVDVAKSVMSQKKHVFLSGVSKSFFPCYQKDTALLSDKDIFSLASGNISVSPSVEFLNEKEDILANLAVLSASETLALSYSEICSGGKETECDIFAKLKDKNTLSILSSEYHYALEKLGVSLEDALKSDEISKAVARETIDNCVFSKTDAIELFSRELTKKNSIATEISTCIYSAFESIGESDILDGISKERNIEFVGYPLARRELSPTQIEGYFACPYSSFLTQNIRLAEREVGVLKDFDTGNYLHYLLEEFSQKMQDMTESDISTEVAKISAKLSSSPAFAKFTNQEKFQFVFSRLARESEKICKHIYKSTEISNFRPTLHEFAFGGDKPVKTPSGLSLRGKIDRVDIFCNDAIVIDYKTGHIDLSESAFYHGLKIQSELYLYAVSKLTGKNPCGCLYLPIYDDFKPTPPSYKMKGKLLKDDEFLNNLDKTLENNCNSEIYPIGKTTKGVFRKDAKTILEKDTFEKHIADAVKTAEQGKIELDAGYISPSPYLDSSKDACAYCKYKSICKTCGEKTTRGGKLKEDEN